MLAEFIIYFFLNFFFILWLLILAYFFMPIIFIVFFPFFPLVGVFLNPFVFIFKTLCLRVCFFFLHLFFFFYSFCKMFFLVIFLDLLKIRRIFYFFYYWVFNFERFHKLNFDNKYKRQRHIILNAIFVFSLPVYVLYLNLLNYLYISAYSSDNHFICFFFSFARLIILSLDFLFGWILKYIFFFIECILFFFNISGFGFFSFSWIHFLYNISRLDFLDKADLYMFFDVFYYADTFISFLIGWANAVLFAFISFFDVLLIYFRYALSLQLFDFNNIISYYYSFWNWFLYFLRCIYSNISYYLSFNHIFTRLSVFSFYINPLLDLYKLSSDCSAYIYFLQLYIFVIEFVAYFIDSFILRFWFGFYAGFDFYYSVFSILYFILYPFYVFIVAPICFIYFSYKSEGILFSYFRVVLTYMKHFFYCLWSIYRDKVDIIGLCYYSLLEYLFQYLSSILQYFKRTHIILFAFYRIFYSPHSTSLRSVDVLYFFAVTVPNISPKFFSRAFWFDLFEYSIFKYVLGPIFDAIKYIVLIILDILFFIPSCIYHFFIDHFVVIYHSILDLIPDIIIVSYYILVNFYYDSLINFYYFRIAYKEDIQVYYHIKREEYFGKEARKKRNKRINYWYLFTLLSIEFLVYFVPRIHYVILWFLCRPLVIIYDKIRLRYGKYRVYRWLYKRFPRILVVNTISRIFFFFFWKRHNFMKKRNIQPFAKLFIKRIYSDYYAYLHISESTFEILYLLNLLVLIFTYSIYRIWSYIVLFCNLLHYDASVRDHIYFIFLLMILLRYDLTDYDYFINKLLSFFRIIWFICWHMRIIRGLLIIILQYYLGLFLYDIFCAFSFTLANATSYCFF